MLQDAGCRMGDAGGCRRRDLGWGMWDGGCCGTGDAAGLGMPTRDLGFGVQDTEGLGMWDVGCRIRDAGFGIQDKQCGMRDSG